MFLTDSHIESLTARTKPKGAVTAEKISGSALKTIETVGAASGMAFMNARYAKQGRNAFEIAGVPLDIALGVIGTFGALSGWAGEHSEDLHNVSNGLLCAAGVRLGMMWGADARVTKMRVEQQQAQGAPNYAARNLPPPSTQYSFPLPNGERIPSTAPSQYDWAA